MMYGSVAIGVAVSLLAASMPVAAQQVAIVSPTAKRAPEFMRIYEAIAGLGLNLVAFVSTMVWQRRIQGEMAATGYDEQKVRTLIRTNWIRTSAHLLLAALAIVILLRGLLLSHSWR